MAYQIKNFYRYSKKWIPQTRELYYGSSFYSSTKNSINNLINPIHLSKVDIWHTLFIFFNFSILLFLLIAFAIGRS